MTLLRARAPGKVNLCLLLGPRRCDGRHELVSLLECISLADELTLRPSPAARVGVVSGGPGLDRERVDEVSCPGVSGSNLAARALAAFRSATGWAGPPVRLEIDKRIPVAGGMGGGSGDVAAALRLAARAAGHPDDGDILARLAPGLGSDVPAMLLGGLSLVTGAGERVQARPALAPHALLLLPAGRPLSTADVYAEADRQGLQRPAAALERAARTLGALVANAPLPAALAVNDLEPAARALCPEIGPALDAAREEGAARAFVSGSGPTVVGLFEGVDAHPRAAAAVRALERRWPRASVALPVSRAFAAPWEDPS